MKYELRIPAKEQYAYISVFTDSDECKDPVAKYNEITRYIHGGTGISSREFNHLIDDLYLDRPYTTVDGEPFEGDDIMVLLPKLGAEQKGIFDALARCKARTK